MPPCRPLGILFPCGSSLDAPLPLSNSCLGALYRSAPPSHFAVTSASMCTLPQNATHHSVPPIWMPLLINLFCGLTTTPLLPLDFVTFSNHLSHHQYPPITCQALSNPRLPFPALTPPPYYSNLKKGPEISSVYSLPGCCLTNWIAPVLGVLLKMRNICFKISVQLILKLWTHRLSVNKCVW